VEDGEEIASLVGGEDQQDRDRPQAVEDAEAADREELAVRQRTPHLYLPPRRDRP
jgi:hypothetical protein